MNSERSSGFLIAMGQPIARRRRQPKQTQETAAERMGVSLQTVSCFEPDKKRSVPKILVDLCRVPDVSPDYLRTGAAQPQTLNRLEGLISRLTDEDRALVGQPIGRLSYDGSVSRGLTFLL